MARFGTMRENLLSLVKNISSGSLASMHNVNIKEETYSTRAGDARRKYYGV